MPLITLRTANRYTYRGKLYERGKAYEVDVPMRNYLVRTQAFKDYSPGEQFVEMNEDGTMVDGLPADPVARRARLEQLLLDTANPRLDVGERGGPVAPAGALPIVRMAPDSPENPEPPDSSDLGLNDGVADVEPAAPADTSGAGVRVVRTAGNRAKDPLALGTVKPREPAVAV